MILARHSGRLVLIGFGSAGRAALPLILRHIAVDPARVIVITADGQGAEAARNYGVAVSVNKVTRANHRDLLLPLLAAGDLLINLGRNVSSAALVALCREAGALYLDTAIESWPQDDCNAPPSPAQRTSQALRDSLSSVVTGSGSPTALIEHGANPGLVSHFVKEGLSALAADIMDRHARLDGPADWAALAKDLDVRVIHITERDTQAAAVARTRGEFVNTWSPEGLVEEACQPAELAWGTHEHTLPVDATHAGHADSVFLARPGAATLVRSWTPAGGPYLGFLMSHVESLTISDFYSVHEAGAVRWRPTVTFVYRPCDDALASIMELADGGWRGPRRTRLLLDDIVQGADELGVLLMGHARGAFWFGSHLSATVARTLAPSNNATTLQVAAGILGGLVWLLENTRAGLRLPDEIDHHRVLEIARPYLGDFRGVYSDWTPLVGRTRLFSERMDSGSPWQFGNFRLS
jgi:homospermidine synthase